MMQTKEGRIDSLSQMTHNLAKRIELLEKQIKLHEETIGNLLKIMTGGSVDK